MSWSSFTELAGYLPNVHSVRHFAQGLSGPKINACAGLCHSNGAATTVKSSGQRITVSTLSIRRYASDQGPKFP